MKFLPQILRSDDGGSKTSALDNIFDAFGKKGRPQDVEFRAKIDHYAERGAQRLLDVFNANVVPLAPDYASPVYLKSKEESEFIRQALSRTWLFDKLRKYERHDLIMAFEKHPVTAGTQIIKEGDKVEYFYILQTGTVIVLPDKEEKQPGDFMGELALLYDYPSEATYEAKTDCILWRLDQVTYAKVLASHAKKEDKETKDLLKKVSLFQELDDDILTRVAFALEMKTFEKGETIIKRGDEIKCFYIVKEGSVKATDIVIGESKYDDIVFKPGDSFGEVAITKNEPVHLGTATAEGPVTMLCLERSVFVKLFGGMEDLIRQSQDKKKLRAIPIADKPELDDYELDLVTSLIKTKTFPAGHVLLRQGYRSTKALYLVRSGKVSIHSSTLGKDLDKFVGIFGFNVEGETTTVSKGGYFGADTLSEGEAKPSQYTITAEEDCTVGVLTMEDILSVLAERGRKDIQMDELEMHRILGAGTFGKVWLCSKRGTRDSYALKVQSKRKTIEYGQVEGVVREKNAMARLDHPFIIKLVNSFKDDRSLYMLMVLYQGGELRSILHTDRRHGVPEGVAAFYAANILQGLSFMHRQKIIHRDLKPENVLLNSEGYTVIVDLGFARVVRDKTFTFCGTPPYIAPEVIKQKGYDKSADLWSWGVMIYEMVVGINPFYDRKMSEMTLFRKIVDGDFSFPRGNDFMSGESKNLIRQMLATNPRERLGCLAKGDQDIRDHPWFTNVDFSAIEAMQAKVPWVPKVKDPLDGGNFARWDPHDKDEAEKPLNAREQHLFDDF